MEAGTVPDDHVLVIRIRLPDLQQERLGPVHVHAGRLHEDASSLDRIYGPVAVAPLVSGQPAFNGAKPLERPAPAKVGKQPVAALVGEPDDARLAPVQRQSLADG